MGNDKGDVPLSFAARFFSVIASRMGSLLFAFLLFALPVAAHDDLPDRCGSGMRSRPEWIRGRSDGAIQSARPVLATFVDAPSGRFRIHYDTSGTNAVETDDADGNGIPDYVDECIQALEHSWAVQIDTLGYTPPPTDAMDGGSGALDIYVVDLGPSGFYGRATPDRELRRNPTSIWTSYLEIDNNFSPTDSAGVRPSYTTTGLDALRITCAHEFHHAVQNGSYALVQGHQMLYELTSTWMEMRCYPDVRDWAVWSADMLRNPGAWPLSRADGKNGYRWGWFGNVLASFKNDGLRLTWQLIGQGRSPFAALVDACSQSGSSFEEAMCQATEALYRTGTRGASNTIMPMATLLPEITVQSTLTASGSSTTFTGSLVVGELRTLRLNLISPTSEKANADVVMTISDARLLASDTLRSVRSPYSITLNSDPSPQDVPLASTGWGVRVAPDIHCFVVEGSALLETRGPFPQPFDHATSQTLWVPVTGTFIGQGVRITMLDLDMRPVFNETVRVTNHEHRIVAPVTVNPSLAPGTYMLYVDEETDSPTLHKIFIR